MAENKVTVIGIAGGTGCGKTTVVKRLVEALPPHFVAVVPLDSYYNDTTHMPEEERRAINFDHPDAFDWKLLHQQLADLRAGKAIEQPTYSYLKCNREKETIHVEPKPVIIIEGIMTLVDKQLRDLMDLKVFVDTDADERLIRNIQRDTIDRGRTVFHGGRSLSEGAQANARTVYRTNQALCRHHHSSGRRECYRYWYSLQICRGIGRLKP